MSSPVKQPERPVRRTWFELVRTDSGWHARLVGTNGEIVMASEVYPDRRDAEHVLGLCRGAITRNEMVDERTGEQAGPDAEGQNVGGDSPPASEPGGTEAGGPGGAA